MAMDHPNRRPRLIVVCGLPATGKSSLARELRDALRWPLFSKDGFKELLFDAVHRGDAPFTREDSSRIGAQAMALLLATGRELLESGVPCILESNFDPRRARGDFGPLLQVGNVRQVHCSVPDDVTVERYKARADSGERHPVHADGDDEARLRQRIAEGAGVPLPLDAPLLQVETTDGWKPGIEEIVAFCRT